MEDYSEVVEEDFKGMNDTFRSLQERVAVHIMENPVLGEVLDTFIVDVGMEAKKIMERYGKHNLSLKLEAEDYQRQVQDMRHKMVKMNLALKPIVNAMNVYTNASKS